MRRRSVGAALVAGAAIAWMGCGGQPAERGGGLVFAEATRRPLEVVAEASGTVEPIRKVDVMSRASGEVLEVLVETGDLVEAGALLARIDPRDVQTELDQAEADYEVARERFAIAEAQLRRSEDMLRSGLITDQEHEGRSLEYANARAALVRAEATLAHARARREDVTIRAPLSGTILSRRVEPGQVITSPAGSVSGGTVLLTIADLGVVQVRALVNENDVGRIEPGMEATVRVDAFPDRTFRGHVEKIEPEAVVSQSVVAFPVIVRMPNPDHSLRPGMSATVDVLLARRANALTVPNHAIVGVQEAGAAAGYLGLPEDAVDLDPVVFQELRASLAAATEGEGAGEPRATGGAAPPGSGSARGGAPAGDAPGTGPLVVQGAPPATGGAPVLIGPGPGPGGPVLIGPGPGGPGPGPGPGGSLVFVEPGPGGRLGSSVQDPATAGRPGVVFVQEGDGTLRPRPVLVGVTDWTDTEILAGLEEGERVVLLGGIPAQIQQPRAMGGLGGPAVVERVVRF